MGELNMQIPRSGPHSSFSMCWLEKEWMQGEWEVLLTPQDSQQTSWIHRYFNFVHGRCPKMASDCPSQVKVYSASSYLSKSSNNTSMCSHKSCFTGHPLHKHTQASLFENPESWVLGRHRALLIWFKAQLYHSSVNFCTVYVGLAHWYNGMIEDPLYTEVRKCE